MKTILIVDDIYENLYLLRVILEGSGYSVVEAKDGREGLEKLETNNIDLIISDILMPVMDGYMFCQACKKQKKFKDIPFIFYTSTYTEKLDEDFALKLGAVHFLRKPTDQDKIELVVDEIFKEVRPKVKPLKNVKFTEQEVLKLYSKRLISKLEQKNLDLENEVAERIKAQKALVSENEILDLIAKNTSLKKIFNHIILNYESSHPEYMGSISLLQKDGVHLELISAPTMPEDYNEAVRIAVIGQNVGSCGTAAFLKKEVIVADIGKDKLWVDYKDLALEHNLRSCWSIPIFSENKSVLGTFAIYSDSVKTPTQKDINELNSAVQLAKIAIVKYNIMAEVKKREESYKSLVDQASDAIITYTLDGTIYDFNKAAASSLGYTKNEFSKLNIQDFIVGDIIQKEQNKKLLLEGSAILFERQLIRKDGALIDAEISAKLQSDGKILGIVRDITEWKKNLNEIKLAKEFSAGLLKSMNEGLVVLNLASEIVSVNPSFCEMIGFSEKELIGHPRPYPFLPPELKEENDKRYQLLKEGKIIKDFESVYMHKNGTRFPVQIFISSIYDEEGEKTADFATVLDISERKKAEIALKAAKEFSDRLIMSMQEGLLIVDLDGKIIMVNNSLCKILGYTQEELIGLNLPYPFAKSEDLELMLAIKEDVAKGVTKSFQLEFLRKNGEKFLSSFLSGNILDDNGEVIALFGTVKDITEEDKVKKALEENAKKSNEKKDVILELASYVGEDFSEALSKITQLSAKTLNVERVSVWSFNDIRDEIQCEKLFQLSEKQHKNGTVLRKNDNKNYFKALNKEKAILIRDAVNDDITKGFAKNYLVPNNIASLMDVFINSIEGYYGIICFEHVGEPREWTADEQEFATSIANIVSLMVEGAERRAAENELKSEKEFSENLITSLNEGLSVVSLDGVHIKVNPALCEMTGFTEKELVGIKAPFPYWPPEEQDKIFEAFNDPVKSFGVNKKGILMRKNGERFPVTLSDSIIKNDNGEIVAYFTTITDITLRVKAENILKENIKISNQRKNIIVELANLISEDFDSSLRNIAIKSAKALNVEYVTIWKYQNEKSELLSKLFYSSEEKKFDKDGLVIKKKDYPNYFKAFENKNSINISDVVNNPITKDFSKIYLIPNKITSRIDVIVYGRNTHFGIISFETTTKDRVFNSEEESFVTSIASIVSLMIESYERKQAETKIALANKQLLEANEELNILRNQLEQENVYLRNELDLVFNYEEMVYGSLEFSNVLTEVEKVAPTTATVLLLGESGTGKELLARAIHNTSTRNNKPLIKVNCSAIPRELIESELFGHKKGSFTGAFNDKVGKFELADGGTLFLDEIGELPLDMQPKILRFLQEGEIEVVGGTGLKKLDVRVIAATNRNLKEEIAKKQFREDLYFRLNVFPIEIPPLRQRKDDIPFLVEHFVDKFNKAYGKNIKYITDDAMTKLQAYEWPGNIRELENLIERASILSNNETLIIPGFESKTQKTKSLNNKDVSLDTMQRNHILSILEKCNWKISGKNGAAELLDLKPSTLRDKMSKLGIKKPTSN